MYGSQLHLQQSQFCYLIHDDIHYLDVRISNYGRPFTTGVSTVLLWRKKLQTFMHLLEGSFLKQCLLHEDEQVCPDQK